MSKTVYIVHHTYKGLWFFDGVYEDKNEALKKASELKEEEAQSKEKAKRHYGITDTTYYPSEGQK